MSTYHLIMHGALVVMAGILPVSAEPETGFVPLVKGGSLAGWVNRHQQDIIDLQNDEIQTLLKAQGKSEFRSTITIATAWRSRPNESDARLYWN